MKAVELTKNEREVLVAIVANAEQIGDSGTEFILEDIVKPLNKSMRSISGTASSLQKKGLVAMNNGEAYFDGCVTEAGLHEVESSKVNNNQEVKTQSNKSKNMATNKSKTVKVEDSKSVNNAVDNFDTPVMDERILKLNEFKAVKMASLWKGRRPAAKKAKELATYILNNWDNLAELKKIKAEDVAEGDIWNIVVSRLKNFEDASKAAAEAVKAIDDVYKDVNGNEIKTGDFIEDLSEGFEGEINEVFETEDGLAINQDGTTIFLFEVETEKYCKIVKAPKAKTEKKETKKAAPDKAPKADSKKAEPKVKEEEQPKEKEAKTARKVGDVHPNHPTWIWTEYKPGKFDWRTNPADKKQGQRTDRAATSEKKSEPKKDTKKSTNKKVAKGGKAKKEAPKELTIDEFVALPVKSAKNSKKPSEAQKEALKLVMKGYRVTADHKFFENAEGDKKACNWASVVAMLKRYGMDYIPAGLVK